MRCGGSQTVTDQNPGAPYEFPGEITAYLTKAARYEGSSIG